MKIVYCIDSIGPGGKPQITVFKANALAKKPGNLVWIIYTDPPLDDRIQLPSDLVRLIDLGINYRDNHLRFPWNLFRIYIKIKKHKRALTSALQDICPDIVVSTGHEEKYFLGSIKGKWGVIREQHDSKHIELISALSWRDKFFSRILDKLTYRQALDKNDRLVVLSPYEKEAVWGNDARVSVIPNPLRLLSARTSSLNQKRIIAAGRLVAEKNFSCLIRAFHQLSTRFPDWTLSIFGDGPLRPTLLELINTLGLADRVFLPGFVSDMESSFVDSAFFVHPSLYETFGLVILEAMGCGLPVISYDCPFGPRSIISDEIDGFLIPLGDELALTKAMATLMENEHLRKQMGRASLEKAKQYDIDLILLRWEQLFRQVLQEKNT